MSELDIDGVKRGPSTAAYACLSSPASMALVERLADGGAWSVLSLPVNPQERKMEVIVAAEAATLESLCRAAEEAGAPALRVHGSVRATLAGDDAQLGLTLSKAAEASGADGEENAAGEWWGCVL